MSDLTRLIYVSDIDKALFTSDTIAQILIASRKNNPPHNITGMLVCNYQHFLQALEGPEKAVKDLYDKIAQDTRHVNPKVIDVSNIENREFAHWEMGFARTEDDMWPHSGESWSGFSPQQAMETLVYGASLKH